MEKIRASGRHQEKIGPDTIIIFPWSVSPFGGGTGRWLNALICSLNRSLMYPTHTQQIFRQDSTAPYS
jgi:hypothetical protein